jgi:hypothetical protein
MRKLYTKILVVVVIASLTSCKRENKITPTLISALPSNIIVKEKDTNGIFTTILEFSIYANNLDSTYVDSIGFGGNFMKFDFSYFNTRKICLNNPIVPIGFDTFSVGVLQFDNLNRLIGLIDNYSFFWSGPDNESLSSKIFYNTENKITGIDIGLKERGGGCMTSVTGSEFSYFSGLNGNDSLIILCRVAGCAFGPGIPGIPPDTIIVNYLSKENNTNQYYLSYPSIPSLGNSNYFLSPYDYLPMPKLNSKLIDHIYYSRNGLRYTNAYTFDANNRVKTAKIYYFDKAKEELIEFNY